MRLDHSGRKRGSKVSLREAMQFLHYLETAQGGKRHWSEESTHSGGLGLCDGTCLALPALPAVRGSLETSTCPQGLAGSHPDHRGDAHRRCGANQTHNSRTPPVSVSSTMSEVGLVLESDHVVSLNQNEQNLSAQSEESSEQEFVNQRWKKALKRW